MILNYETIYNDESIDEYYQQLALMLSVMKDNLSSFSQLHSRLSSILNTPSKLQMLASELEIILFLRFNKISEANKALDKLLKRTGITLEQKNRLTLLSEVYKSNAI